VARDPQFVDQITRIGFANGVIRIELGVVPPIEDGQQPTLEPSGLLVMSLEGFIRSAATIDAFRKQLLDKGVIRQNPPPA
jgi:hypothetical protein